MVSKEYSFEQAVNHASKEFLKGFICGQFVLFLLLLTFVRMFFLRNGSNTRKIIKDKKKKMKTTEYKSEKKKPINSIEATVMNKLSYNICTHPSETCEWINVLMGMLIESYRRDTHFEENIVQKLYEMLNAAQEKYTFVAPVTVTEFSLGEEFPQIKSAKIRPGEHNGTRTEITINYIDNIKLSVDTQLIINWPKPCIATLPVSLNFTLLQFSGTIACELVSPPDSSEKYLSLSILEDFQIEFEVRSLLGHRTKVKDFPKLTSIIMKVMKNRFKEELVYPNFKRINIPSKI